MLGHDSSSSPRLGVVLSHPTQYCSPWFRFLAENGLPDLRVFYLWNGGVAPQLDPGFGVPVKWDIPLLEGYDYEFVPNEARRPGTSRRFGLNNPELVNRIEEFRPDSVLVYGYNYITFYRLLFSKLTQRVPFLFRGDSHRLGQMRSAECRMRNEGTADRGGRRTEDGKSASRVQASLKERVRRWWIASVFRRFSAFLYVGAANREYLRHHGVPDSKLFFCPHCVDNERFFSETEAARDDARQWRNQLGIQPNLRVVLFAGKFEPRKRPLDLVEAFKAADVPDAVLVLVGNGEQEAELRKRALGSENILFAPFQNQTRMPRTYMLADLFVLPSFDESWGLAVNEAMCMGRPIIVSDQVGCAQDLVRHGQNGLIFPAGNVPALSNASREAFSNPARLEAWGRRSRELICNYSYEQAANGLFSALKVLGIDSKVQQPLATP
jgi:glycosyltransferase involved in cell wall biosynthesis